MVGLPAKNRQLISSEFLCAQCNLLLDQPWQLSCGHRLCRSCIDFDHGETSECPDCRCTVIKSEIYIDRGIINDMKSLKIQCNWCVWTGLFKDYCIHLQTLHSAPKCPYCELKLDSMGQLEQHLREPCLHSSISYSPDSFTHSNSNDPAMFTQDRSIMRNHSLITKGVRRMAKSFSNFIGIVDSPVGSPVNDNICSRNVLPPQTTTGEYIWRIDDVENKIRSAENRCSPCIDSPSFYSSQKHKLCLRLYLYGDESVRSRYVSLFVVLMKGEFDDSIQFPFTKKILLCLYDQTEQRHHKISGFLPHPQSRSFDRPITEKNVASGIPRFLPLKMIRDGNNNFIRDNTMFIKVLICDRIIPERAIRKIMSIDPALPEKIHDEEMQMIISTAIQEENEEIDSLICSGPV